MPDVPYCQPLYSPRPAAISYLILYDLLEVALRDHQECYMHFIDAASYIADFAPYAPVRFDDCFMLDLQ